MKRWIFLWSLPLLLGGCASRPAGEPAPPSERLALFSSSADGGLPSGWEPMVIFRTKKQTEYALVKESDKTVLHARAQTASSGLMQKVGIEPQAQPWLNWQWRIGNLTAPPAGAPHATEDSPVRIILGFDGDKDTLSFSDQILFETARILTGYDFPYATLMYVWDPKAPVGTVMPSNRSGRIKTLVVASGPDAIGQWRDFTRNIVEDYRKAFGESPGKLIGVGVLTDTETPGETVEAWYGDIRLSSDRRMVAGQ